MYAYGELALDDKLNRVNLMQFPIQIWTHCLRRELHQIVGAKLQNNHIWDQLVHNMKDEFTKFCYGAAANPMKINICYTIKAA